MAEFIAWLETLNEAYPEDIFRPIDMREVEDRMYTRDEVQRIASRNAAGMARHVLKRVLAEARKVADAWPAR